MKGAQYHGSYERRVVKIGIFPYINLEDVLYVQTSTRQKKEREPRQSTLQQELNGRLNLSLQQLKLTPLLQV